MNARDDFLAARRRGVGGSDMATILGISPFSTRLELYLEKRGEIPPRPDTSKTRAGTVMEQVIACMVAEREGVKLRRVNRTLHHPQYTHMIAHLDREYVGQRRGLEIKNVSPRLGSMWGKDGTPDAIAEYYLPQVHHYMLVADYPAFDVAAYFGGDDLRLYPIDRDPEMDEILIESAHEFWYDHVLPGVPPEPDYEHKSTLPMLRRRYPGTNGQTIIASEIDEFLLHWAKVAEDAASKAKEYDGVAQAAKNHLLAAMGEAAVLRLDGQRALTRKVVIKKSYEVAATTYIDSRFTNLKD